MEKDYIDKEKYYDSLKELSILYNEVKQIVLLAEYENKEQKYLITSINEIRNAFDHIMRSFSNPEKIGLEILESKKHLYRAGYDAYEIVLLSKLNEIRRIREEFSYDTIVEVYPKYHETVIPTVEKIKESLIKSRSNKAIGIEDDYSSTKNNFDDYEKLVHKITEFTDEMSAIIPLLRKMESLKKAKYSKSFLINILIGLISAISSGLAIYFFLKK